MGVGGGCVPSHGEHGKLKYPHSLQAIQMMLYDLEQIHVDLWSLSVIK